MPKNYVIHKVDDRWMFETPEDGEVKKHFYTAKKSAVNGVLRLHPGGKPIIMVMDLEDDKEQGK